MNVKNMYISANLWCAFGYKLNLYWLNLSKIEDISSCFLWWFITFNYQWVKIEIIILQIAVINSTILKSFQPTLHNKLADIFMYTHLHIK
jgi:hypothetical protein